MIVPETRLKEIFDTLPVITTNSVDYTPIYDFGTQRDLYRFLSSKQKEVTNTGVGNIYPIIWLETPIVKEGNEKRITFPMSLVIATLTTSTFSNTERLAVTFNTTLIPLYEDIIIGLQKSGFTEIVTNNTVMVNSVRRTDYFNYSQDIDENHATTDIWDAIKLECTVRMTDKCLQNFNY